MLTNTQLSYSTIGLIKHISDMICFTGDFGNAIKAAQILKMQEVHKSVWEKVQQV